MRPRNLMLLFLVLVLHSAVLAEDLNEELLAAARKGDAKAVTALLARGADVNAKTRYGVTPLIYASGKGHADVVRVLLAHGANPNAKDTFYGATPMAMAADKGDAAIVKQLLEKGAEDADIALDAGVATGKLELVKVVLAHGGLKPPALNAALAAAIASQHPEVAALLKQAGAEEVKLDVEKLKTYCGAYVREGGTEQNIEIKEGQLVMRATGLDQVGALIPIGEHEFKLPSAGGATITFVFEDGKPAATALKVRGAGPERSLKRVEGK